MTNLVFTPIALPAMAFCLTLLVHKYSGAQKFISIVFAFIYSLLSLKFLIASDNPFLQSGGWTAPFGISLQIDGFSAIMLSITGVIYLATVIYSQLGATAENSRFFFPLVNILICGVSGAFITADLFNLYVWFEVTLLSSFVLMSLGQKKVRLAGAIKYVTLNIISSMVFLISIGLIYGTTHTLNLQDLAEKLTVLNETDKTYITVVGALLFSGFAIKSGLFPFYNWLPASYHTASPALSGIFAGLLTKVGLYAIFKVSGVVFPSNEYFVKVILVLAPLTMLFGVLGAIVQTDIRRILSFHIISQVGYISFAAALVCSESPVLSQAGLAAAIFYMAHHMLVKTNLFFISGIIGQKTGTEKLDGLGGLRQKIPILALLFAIPAISLAGIPPSSGFWAKLALLKASISAEHYLSAGVMVMAGFFTVFSMVKIWNGAFWAENSQLPIKSDRKSMAPFLACLLLAGFSLGISFAPDYLMEKAKQAGTMLSSIERTKP